MSIELQACVVHPRKPKRYLIRVIVGCEDSQREYPCFRCGKTPSRKIHVWFQQMLSLRSLLPLHEGMKTWSDIADKFRDRICEGMPVCAACWDEKELPRIFFLAGLP